MQVFTHCKFTARFSFALLAGCSTLRPLSSPHGRAFFSPELSGQSARQQPIHFRSPGIFRWLPHNTPQDKTAAPAILSPDREGLAACKYSIDPALASACCDTSARDGDGDGIGDSCEQTLAERFAPVIYHSSDESNFPTNVDAFLTKTRLTFVDQTCRPDLKLRVVDRPTQVDLIGHVAKAGCDGSGAVASDGSVSLRKRRSFVLKDVPEADRIGSLDSQTWTTYVHAYPNTWGGVTVQYWQFFAYNDAINNHGGDWEGVFVALDDRLRVVRVRLPGHWGKLEALPPTRLQFENTHVRVYSEGGGHAMRESGTGIVARGCGPRPRCTISLGNPLTFVRQETWSGGSVRWPNGRTTPAGPLLNVGSKMAPVHGQVFIQYSGMWGSPGLTYWTSGYWGPAFNETRQDRDGFFTAWCADMAMPLARGECYATNLLR